MKTVAEGNRNGSEKAGRIEVDESFVGIKIVERSIVLEVGIQNENISQS